ncbi:hypothetical protein [Tateyamaria pelophila]|uniref:hypothetical protein n=1 Tax=Tateyamaria pelophila TaxID=328415 RepID=UPI001CC1786F|nr:hypothetical protein [Tateyamaria pelophila]
MKLDVNRLNHLRMIRRDRLAACRAAADDRLELRDRLRDLERHRARIEMNHGPDREAEALDGTNRRIEAAKRELAEMTDRENELAQASSTAGQTFQRALEYAQAKGLDLPDDLRPQDFGAPAAPVQENA